MCLACGYFRLKRARWSADVVRMRAVKIWTGGMAGLVAGFVVGAILLRAFFPGDGARVTSGEAVSILVVISVPVIVGTLLGAYLVARLTRLSPGREVGSPAAAPAAGRPSGRGDSFGDWAGMALLLGGVAVDDEAVWKLARLVERPLGHKLETALRLRAGVVAVTSAEREAILRALEDAPDGLQGVRELLLTDESWRESHSLALARGNAEREPRPRSAA